MSDPDKNTPQKAEQGEPRTQIRWLMVVVVMSLLGFIVGMVAL